MHWARMLAYVTGRVNQELLLRNEYLGAENRIVRGKIKGRLLLSKGEKATLAEIAHRLGREALENVAATANPTSMTYSYFSATMGSTFSSVGTSISSFATCDAPISRATFEEIAVVERTVEHESSVCC
jgi:hypothetical protein